MDKLHPLDRPDAEVELAKFATKLAATRTQQLKSIYLCTWLSCYDDSLPGQPCCARHELLRRANLPPEL